jgi:hypothetical protein
MMRKLSQIVLECQQIQDGYSCMLKIYLYRYSVELHMFLYSFSKMGRYFLSPRCYKRKHQQSDLLHHQWQQEDTNTLLGEYLEARYGRFRQIESSPHNTLFVLVDEMEEIPSFDSLASKIVTLSSYVVLFHLRE